MDTKKKYIEDAQNLMTDEVRFGQVATEYPILADVFNHLLAGSMERPNVADGKLHLQNALDKYCILMDVSQTTPQARASIIFDYKNFFGLDIKRAITDRYSSGFCKQYGIKKPSTLCPQTSSNEGSPSVKEETGEVQPDNDTYESEQGQDMLYAAIKDLREVLQADLLVREHLEISELPIGDARRIPSVKGAQYEVKFKREDNKKLLYFEPAWYTISDRSGESLDNNYWELYAKGIKDFKKLVLDILKDKDIGEKSFQVYLQGSADAPTFTEKPLAENFNTDFFQNIRLLEIDPAQKAIREALFIVGDKYDNNELPNLRPAFLKFAMLRMDGMRQYENHFHIFKGNVKPYKDPHKRSCYIVLVVDWEAVDAKIKAKDVMKRKLGD